MDIADIICKKIHELKLKEVHSELIHYDAKKYRYNIGLMINDRKNYGVCEICNVKSYDIIDDSCIMARYKRYKYLIKDYCIECFNIELTRLRKIQDNINNIGMILDRI